MNTTPNIDDVRREARELWLFVEYLYESGEYLLQRTDRENIIVSTNLQRIADKVREIKQRRAQEKADQ